MRPLHFTRRQLRHTACVALFAWVFALLSGVANACLTQATERGAAFFGLTRAATMTGCDSGLATCAHDPGQAHHHAGSAHDEPVQDAGKAACLKFCADESSALAKSNASQADLPSPVLMAGARWSPAMPVAAPAQWPQVERPASVGPPLFLRLLRLTT
jgi:hypothetical protein